MDIIVILFIHPSRRAVAVFRVLIAGLGYDPVMIREVEATAARTATNEIHDALSYDRLHVTVEVKVDVCNYCHNITKLHFTRMCLFIHLSCQTSRLSVRTEIKSASF